MRSSMRSTNFVCLTCRLREGIRGSSRLLSTTSLRPDASSANPPIPTPLEISAKSGLVRKSNTSKAVPSRKRWNRPIRIRRVEATKNVEPRRAYSSANTQSVELSPGQQDDLQVVNKLHNRLRLRLQSGLSQQSRSNNERSKSAVSLEEALKSLSDARTPAKEGQFIRKLEELYLGREISASEVLGDLGKLATHRLPQAKVVNAAHTKKLLKDFGLLEAAEPTEQNIAQKIESTLDEVKIAQKMDVTPKAAEATYTSLQEKTGGEAQGSPRADSKDTIAKLDESRLKELEAQKLIVRAMKVPTLPVPTLAYGLRRVLFNQGIQQLQDYRSGVFNFDPYLQRIMPVSEFNFDALGQYVTSSEDQYLRELARENCKKYIGSSSSMTGALAHFHHLLSQFRDINTKTLSKGFADASTNLTAIQRAPSAVFLRYKDGVYGVDADKEFDSANVLMSLGRSLEKLLTVPKKEFEKYRKAALDSGAEQPPEAGPESYHYCEQGDFLLRSQLDAYDPDLPGTGMFDLKTRAVVSIRMNISKHEEGMGYQIKSRFGNYESYEREYYDMIRSAFLKYSLQVRMGRMDGIFVAYHNIDRIFGFQYLPLSEMDLHLHGQEDRSLGDTEFKLSIAFMNEVFDQATKKFPKKSLRFHFEARQATLAPYMYIFAEPLEEHQIQQLQDSRKEVIAEFERRLFNPAPESAAETAETAAETAASTLEKLPASSPPLHNSDGDPDFLNELERQKIDAEQKVLAGAGPKEDNDEERPLLGLKLTIRNKQNGYAVPRPENLTREDIWTVEYNLEEMSDKTARGIYRGCQTRRYTALNQSYDEVPVNSFFRILQELSRKGAAWRKRQDEVDAQRGVRVVYEESAK